MSQADFQKAHDTSDLDYEQTSQHHTIGKGPNQAAAGNHNHDGRYATSTEAAPVGTVALWLGASPPEFWLLLNGQGVNRGDHPGLFSAMNVPVGTDFIYLPDMSGKFPVGATDPATTGDDKAASVNQTTAQVATGSDTTVVTNVVSATPLGVEFNFIIKVA